MNESYDDFQFLLFFYFMYNSDVFLTEFFFSELIPIFSFVIVIYFYIAISLFACLVMASKVWDDLSMWNVVRTNRANIHDDS